MKRLVLALTALWLGRWALREVAMLVGRFWLPPSRPSIDSPRQPGRIPGPFDG